MQAASHPAGMLEQHTEDGRRTLSLSMVRVEVRLYRRSKTAANVVQQPSHFEYIVRCDWTGSPVKRSRGGPRPGTSPRPPGSTESSSLPLPPVIEQEAEDASIVLDVPAGCGARYWWDDLPSSYAVYRRWAEIVKLHEALVTDLVFDSERGCRRVKTRPPVLPDKGDLDAFVKHVAATGDARSLHRPRGETLPMERVRQKTHEELSDLHLIYVENRLSPYFVEISKIFSELPTDVLQESAAVRRFATGGRVTMQSSQAPSPFKQKRIYGPRPVLMPDEEADAAALVARKRPGDFFRLTNSGMAGADGGRSVLSPASPSSSIMSPVRQTSPRSPLVKSASAPSFAAASPHDSLAASPAMGRTSESPSDDGTPRSRTMQLGDTEARDARERRLASSHYGFFAKNLGPEVCREFGSASVRDFWRRMATKEKHELGRRTMLPLGRRDESQRLTQSAGGLRDGGRLPALPPPGPWSQRPPTEPAMAKPTRHTLKSGMRSPGQTLRENKDTTHARTKRAEIRYDICDGLRVTILNEAAETVPRGRGVRNQQPEDRPVHNKVSEEEAKKVYRIYRQLLEMDEGCDDGDVEDSDQEDGEGGNTTSAVAVVSGGATSASSNVNFGPEEDLDHFLHPPPSQQQQRRASRVDMAVQQGMSRELMPISWPTLFTWAQREVDFASHFRYKSVCSALLRALRLWRKVEATKDQRFYGASLNMLFQWMWPNIGYGNMAQVMTWIGLCEIEKIHQPTPYVIDAQERRQLESIFNTMDPQGRGYITAEDIAGGETQGIEAKLRNIVDVDTVRKVCSQKHIALQDFLELMCEDNYRAHEGATHVILDSGQRLVQVAHPALGFEGWVFEDVPKSEEAQRRRILAIEAEVIRWRRMSEVRRTALGHLLSQGNVFL